MPSRAQGILHLLQRLVKITPVLYHLSDDSMIGEITFRDLLCMTIVKVENLLQQNMCVTIVILKPGADVR